MELLQVKKKKKKVWLFPWRHETNYFCYSSNNGNRLLKRCHFRTDLDLFLIISLAWKKQTWTKIRQSSVQCTGRWWWRVKKQKRRRGGALQSLPIILWDTSKLKLWPEDHGYSSQMHILPFIFTLSWTKVLVKGNIRPDGGTYGSVEIILSGSWLYQIHRIHDLACSLTDGLTSPLL